MSNILKKLKEYYKTAIKREFEWHDLFSNNIKTEYSEKEGIFTYFWFGNNGKYEFVKYTIRYMSRVDKEGITHSEEGVKYYVLYELREDFDRIMTVPEPTDDSAVLFQSLPENSFHHSIVNEYGRFRYVFDDEETAKAVIAPELLNVIYPYQYILSESELREWESFVEKTGKL